MPINNLKKNKAFFEVLFGDNDHGYNEFLAITKK